MPSESVEGKPGGSGDRKVPREEVREISVILVSWKDAEELAGAVESLAAARERVPPGGPRVSLFVVDNGGALDGDLLRSLWPVASLSVNPANRGFGPAANQAAGLAAGDVLFFVNPDARAEGDLFTEIARGFRTHPEAVALAPRLLDLDENLEGRNPKSEIVPRPLAPPGREDQFTFQLRRLPGLLSDARELLLFDHVAPDNASRRRFRYADSDRGAPFEVEQAAAAALAVRAGVFARVGGFDESFAPAWFEDVDLCRRLLAEGRILYWPEARLRHRGNASAGVLGYPRFLPIYYGNALRYRRLHYSLPARLLYRPLLAAGMLLRLSALPFRPSPPRPRKESARAYLRVLSLALGLKSPITNHQSQIP